MGHVPNCTIKIAQQLSLKIVALYTCQVIFHNCLVCPCAHLFKLCLSHTVDRQWQHIVHRLQFDFAFVMVDDR